jgi:hypothetical protein
MLRENALTYIQKLHGTNVVLPMIGDTRKVKMKYLHLGEGCL